MLDYQQLAVACHFGSASKADIEVYIQSVVESGAEYDNRIFEAYANDLGVARVKLLEFIAVSYPDFQIKTAQCLGPCRAELKRQIGLLLDEVITPSSFCEFFNAMEMQLVIDSEFAPDEVAFLGDLYNCCDWCDDTWTLENSRHLAEEGSRIVSEIDKAEQAVAANRDPRG
ncbi:MAG: hypothetical protein AAGC74_00225 [Verrucomicrobiota bacterium]